MKAKKRFGQNFLIDKNIINIIINEFYFGANDLIVEIGPGRGALTSALKEKNARIIAYELDKDLQVFLNKLENDRIKIIYQDILKSNIKNDIKDIDYQKLYIVGNLPYYITTPIIEHIISLDLHFEKFVIMVQKEVADRFTAKPKTKEYGYMTLLLQYYFDIEKVCDVPSYCFNPAPKVESSVISLTQRQNKPNIDIEKYKLFLQKCFMQKRKTLKNNLSGYNGVVIKDILNKYNLNEQVRAEELSEEIIIELFNNLN